MVTLPCLFVVVGCSSRLTETETAGGGSAAPTFCTTHDPCNGPRAPGARCAQVYDLCTHAYVACPCVSGTVCADGVCTESQQQDPVQHSLDERQQEHIDPEQHDQQEHHRPCDPVNPCRGPQPENAQCGAVSAGCPGVTVACACASGLACIDRTCRRPAAGGAGGGGPCRADASHCCMPDGRLVRPGGCQPIYTSNVQPATRRNPDGTCEAIPCTVRCLPETVMIDTPDGPRRVSMLSVGDRVFTRDETGARIVAPVLRVRSLEVTSTHSVVELSLADGRVVRASPGHPLAPGTLTFGDLGAGDRLDGAEIIGVRTLPYAGVRTWDLLPEGPTGAYWADGVLVGSTLRSAP